MAKLTDDFVQKLQPMGPMGIQVFDDKLPGFGVRKFASGKASYFVKYSIGKQQRRLTLGRVVRGNLQAMRLEASKILLQAHAGVDVVAERRKAARAVATAKTLGELVPLYLRVREFGNNSWDKLRPRSLVATSHYLEKAWQPLHAEPVDKITRQMVKRRRDEIASESGSVTANQALAALSTFYRWAIDADHVPWAIDKENVSGANPTRDIKALKKTKRDRFLSEAELVDVWQACDDDDFGRIVKLLMLTGQRRQEIAELEWSEISVEKRQISLPAARTKNKQPHIIPLSEPALALLGDPQGRYVFGGVSPFKSWHRKVDWLDKRIAERRGAPLQPPWVLHDLRRSVVTHLAELKIAPPHVIEAIVNHVSGHKAGICGTYNRASYSDEKRAALDHWGRVLIGQVSSPLTSAKNSTPEKSEEIDRQLTDGTR